MPRVLYIDVPFEKLLGEDRNRGPFIWSILHREFAAEAVQTRLFRAEDRSTADLCPPSAGRLTVVRALPAGFLESPSVFRFPVSELDRFAALLDLGRFDLVYVRGAANWHLARAAERHPGRPAVVLDLDLLPSRLAESCWSRRPSLRRRRFLLEKWRLKLLERRIARRPYLFLFSSPAEAEYFRTCIAMEPAPGRFAVLPHALPAGQPAIPLPGPRILFFGRLDAPENEDALEYLLDTILPLIAADLRRHKVKLVVAGSRPPGWFAERVRRLDPGLLELRESPTSLEATIAESSFVILPVRVASGTRIRILEAAAQRRTVITTRLGAEGIDLGEDALVRPNAQAFAAGIRELLDAPALAAQLGRRLHSRCAGRHAPAAIAADLVRELTEFAATRPKP